MQEIIAQLASAMQGFTDALNKLMEAKTALELHNATLADALREIAGRLVALADDLDPPEG